MTVHGPPPKGATSDECLVVWRAIGASPHRLPALDIARATGLSTLVVVPAIALLMEDRLVSRAVVTQDGEQTWGYHLTVEGRRRLRARV